MGRIHSSEAKSTSVQGFLYDEVVRGKDGLLCGIYFHVEQVHEGKSLDCSLE